MQTNVVFSMLQDGIANAPIANVPQIVSQCRETAFPMQRDCDTRWSSCWLPFQSKLWFSMQSSWGSQRLINDDCQHNNKQHIACQCGLNLFQCRGKRDFQRRKLWRPMRRNWILEAEKLRFSVMNTYILIFSTNKLRFPVRRDDVVQFRKYES